MTTWDSLALTMLHVLWVGTVIGLAALASKLVLRGTTPAIRYAVALVWLGLLTASPAFVWWSIQPAPAPATLTSIPPAPPVHLPPTTPTSTPPDLDAIPTNTVSLLRDSQATPTAFPTDTSAPWQPAMKLLPAIWFVGSFTMFAWSLLGLSGAERLRRASTAVGRDLHATIEQLASRVGTLPVAVLACTRVGVPIVVGVLRPAILLPPAVLAGLSPRELELVLLHELAHVRRWDNLVNLLQRLAESALFFHPAVWAISAWVRQERENCCDDLAIAAAGHAPAADYAAMLVRVHALGACAPCPLASPSTGGDLIARVRRLVTRRDPMRLSRTSLAALAACATLSGLLILLPAPAPATAQPDAKVISVQKDGGDHQSIQAALDAAPDGAVIRIGPGTWTEHLTIIKPVTLQGAGWDQTTITAPIPAAALEAAKILGEQREKGLTNGEWIKRSNQIVSESNLRPTIRINGTRGASLRDLKVLGIPAPHWDGSPLTALSLVDFDRATGSIDNCAIVGSTGTGVHIANDSDVRIDRSLVAAHWSTGVVVGRHDGAPAKATISDSDLRVCYYAGLTVGPKSDATVQRCRIWGAAWHGIRYDNASPTIRDNTIYNVARLNIYANGDTRATITGNLIAGSEGSGIWCLSGNRDHIAENTFTSNTQSAISVTGDAEPLIERNLFFHQEVAVICGKQQGSEVVGHPKLASNWVWPDPKARTPLQPSVDPTTHVQDPGLSLTSGNYTLPADSPARTARVGAAEPPPYKSPFPIQPQEQAIMPPTADWDYQLWKKG